MAKPPKVPFKAGDDFILTLTVTNKVSVEAVAAATAVIEAQALYDAESVKSDPDEVLLASLLVDLNDAKDLYDEAIIVDITGWVITASMRWISKLMAEFIVEIVNPLTGKFTLEAPAEDTQAWKPRVYDADVQFIIDGKKSSSQTFQIDVKRDITMEEVI